MIQRPLVYVIDALGACNLRCPSCPVGNLREVSNPQGFLHPELLDRILTKATSESPIWSVLLFNWSEPFLHPLLTELIEVVHRHGIQCWLSSNLNYVRDLDAVLGANPEWFRVSVSGFTPATYNVTHKGGDIDVVKRNMALLAEAHDRTHSRTKIHVYYIKYLESVDEVPLMKAYAASLGFEWQEEWAFLLPLEKSLAYLDGGFSHARLTPDDLRLIDSLALPLGEASAVLRDCGEVPCLMQTDMISINHRGDVTLCCTTYDAQTFGLGNFLDHPLEHFLSAKTQSPICTRCKSHGLHIYYSQGETEKRNQVATAHIASRRIVQ